MLKQEDINQLLALNGTPVLSMYLHTNAGDLSNQAVEPAWRIWLKNAIRTLDAQIDGEQAQIWEKVRSRVEAYLKNINPQAKSIAAFYGADFEQVFELPIEVENQISLGKAVTAPLLWVLDEYEPYLIVLVDQHGARFFQTYLGNIEFQDTLELDLDNDEWRKKTMMSNPAPVTGMQGAVHGGTGQDDYEDRVDEHLHRMYKDVVERLAVLMRQNGIGRLILGGSEQSAHAVKNLLPEKMSEKLAGMINLPLRSPLPHIMNEATTVALNYERQQELELVQQVIDLAKAGGRGALGQKEVLEALNMQRVELLILPWKDSTEYRDMPEKVHQSGGKIEFVQGAATALLHQEGGIAARLYYAL